MRMAEDRRYMLLALAVGIAVRAIPNLLTPYPIGYDTIYYATQILDWRAILSDPNVIFQTPLHLLIMSPIHVLTGADPFTILRIAQPLLYGFLTASFYYTARNLFQWEPRQAFLAATIFSLQTATLRISWDLLRNELSLAILLLTLPRLRNNEKNPIAFAVLSTLVVLSHQMTSVILFFIITFFFINSIRKREYNQARRLLLSSSPSALFFAGVIANNSGVLHFPVLRIPSTFPKVESIPIKWSLPLPFFNYLAGEGLVDYGQSYTYLLADVVSLYLASYLVILPLVVAGFRSLREKTIDLWTAVCTFASLMCLVTPRFAILYWDRWMQLLVVPYTFYASNGIIKISNNRIKISRRNLAAIACSIYAVIAILYMTTPYTNPISPYAAIWPSSKYSPPTMLINTAPIEDTPNIEQALQWLNQNMERDSCLLTKDTFVYWAKIYLKKEGTIVNYQHKDVSDGLRYAKLHNYVDIYWIWWENGVGLTWYGQQVPREFKLIYKTGNIAVYKYINL
jgi:hypothetical protein